MQTNNPFSAGVSEKTQLSSKYFKPNMTYSTKLSSVSKVLLSLSPLFRCLLDQHPTLSSKFPPTLTRSKKGREQTFMPFGGHYKILRSSGSRFAWFKSLQAATKKQDPEGSPEVVPSGVMFEVFMFQPSTLVVRSCDGTCTSGYGLLQAIVISGYNKCLSLAKRQAKQ